MSTALTLEAPAQLSEISAPRARWLPMVAIAWLVIWAGFLFINLDRLGAVAFHDPDDELRLVQVRDLIAGQGWFDLHQYRIDPAGGGVLMHWSRLVDVPIAAVILVLRPLLGPANAELAALIVLPALTLFAIMALVGSIASRTLPTKGSRLLAVLAVALAVPVMVQVSPLRIDHHGWQIVMALAAVAAFLHPDARRGGWLSGAALAAWMAISFEGLPLSAWFVVVLALWTLVDPAMRARLVATMQSLAVCSALLFLATRGTADLAQHCDAIAPVHLAMFAWGALAMGVAAKIAPASRIVLAASFGLAAAGALALVVMAAPQCTSGSFDMLDPVVRSFWYDSVLEGKPLWHAEAHLAAQYLIPALIGLWAAASLARASDDSALRRWWIFYALILGGAIALSLAVTRSAAFSGALAALPLGWRLAAWIGGLKRPANPVLRLGELVGTAALVFCALFPAIPVLAGRSLFDNDVARGAGKKSVVACSVGKAGGALDALPPGAILAPLDIGPNVLLYSNKAVLATAHHRGAPAMRGVIDAFTGTPEQARVVMAQHGLRYVMICPEVPEIDLYRKRAPDGFAAQLLTNRNPAWLRAVPLPAASGLKMWELAE